MGSRDQANGLKILTLYKMDSHPLHAAMVGALIYAGTGNIKLGFGVGSATLVYMMRYGHKLPSFAADPTPTIVVRGFPQCGVIM